MKFSISKLKGAKVYFFGKNEPWGVFSDIMLDKDGKIAAYIVKTLSIVPISKAIQSREIESIEAGRIILKRGIRLVNYEQFKKTYSNNAVKSKEVKKVVFDGIRTKKLKDMQFEFETGEMCDIVVSENIITGKHKLSVNKITAKDNTIYI